MASKHVRVDLHQGPGFRTECRTGPHTVVIDQPATFGGTNAGPTPLELQLMAVGGCIAGIGRIVANQRRLAIRSISVVVEGELETDRSLGKPTQARAGFGVIRAKVDIDADLSQAEKQRLLRDIDERCPISDGLRHPVPLEVVLA